MHISNQIKSFDYLGSKYSILPWLLPKLPRCNHYVSVFGGSAADLINREPSPIETFNDINQQVVNFFKVLRETPESLIESLQLTPHSKYEYDNAWESVHDSDIEKARKFFIRTQQSIFSAGAQEKVKGWAAALKCSRVSISEKTHKWINRVDGLYAVAERFKHTQIECRDFRFILKHYDDAGTLFYCDSPYMKTLRSSSEYRFEFTMQDHFDLHHYASRIKGRIAISGYKEDIMLDLYKDFNFHEGPKRKNNISSKDAIECIWTNY